MFKTQLHVKTKVRKTMPTVLNQCTDEQQRIDMINTCVLAVLGFVVYQKHNEGYKVVNIHQMFSQPRDKNILTKYICFQPKQK